MEGNSKGSWKVTERRFFWSEEHGNIILCCDRKPMFIDTPNTNDQKFLTSSDRAYVEGADKRKFESWHVYTWSNLADGLQDCALKAEIKKMYDNKKKGWYHDERGRQNLAIGFNKTYMTRRIKTKELEEALEMEDLSTKRKTNHWCSKIRGFSLQHQAASVIARRVNDWEGINKLVREKILPGVLAELIKEYV